MLIQICIFHEFVINVKTMINIDIETYMYRNNRIKHKQLIKFSIHSNRI